ncbi:MAG: hypothetical protein B1H03_02430 [Planctomycetales bacterium 4484_113]|nr:MAG: hypothetical protein B1H03_02430 [Planctomycetales bacterium 4484_113]
MLAKSPQQSESALPSGLSLFHLENGFQLLVRESHENPTVSLSGSVSGGSLLDAEGKRGASVMVTNLLLRGTHKHSWQEIARELEDRGMMLTFRSGRENVSLAARCLTEDTEKLLSLLAEVLRYPSFPPEQVELVRKAIDQSILRSEDETFDRAYYTGRDLLYGEVSAYAGRTSGTHESLASITTDDLFATHGLAFRPGNTILAVVGDVRPEQVRQQVEELLGDWQGKATPLERFIATAQEARALSGRRVELPMPHKSNATLVAMRPGLSRTSSDYYAALLANYIFGGDFMSRLNERLRVQEGLTYGAYSFMNAGLGAGPWNLVAQVAPGQVDAAEELLLAEWERFAQDGVSQEELARGKAFLTGNHPVRLHTPLALAGALTDVAFYRLDYGLIEEFPAVIDALSLEEVNTAIRKHFTRKRYVILIAGSLA